MKTFGKTLLSGIYIIIYQGAWMAKSWKLYPLYRDRPSFPYSDSTGLAIGNRTYSN